MHTITSCKKLYTDTTKARRTKIGLYLLIAGILSFIVACEPVTPFDFYNENLFRGKELMKRGEFEEARAYFVKAYELQRLPEPLVYAAIASYKINDMKWADYYIREADRYDCKGLTELRIDGYKALIFIKEDNMNEGFRALQEYTEFYSHLRPLMNIWEVEAMVKKRRIDIVRLEILIDEQIDRYEDEIEQYRKTGTGPYGAGS